MLQKLGSPTLTVTSDSFVPMLSRLDECIAYLNKHVSNFPVSSSQIFAMLLMVSYRNRKLILQSTLGDNESWQRWADLLSYWKSSIFRSKCFSVLVAAPVYRESLVAWAYMYTPWLLLCHCSFALSKKNCSSILTFLFCSILFFYVFSLSIKRVACSWVVSSRRCPEP